MGLQDRDYSRERSQGDGGGWQGTSGGGSWGGQASMLGGGATRSITLTLIIINVVVFFLDMVLSGGGGDARSVMAQWFEVRADTLVKPWMWYRFLSYGFVHSMDGIGHLAFNMLGLFIFGRVVESRMGSREFLRFYLLALAIGGLVAALRWAWVAIDQGAAFSAIPVGTIGASGAVMAVTILFAFYFPDATILLMLIFPVKAWVVAVLYVVMNLYGAIGGSGPVAYEVHLAGAGFAALYHLRGWRLGFLRLDAPLELWDSVRRRRPKLRLHDPEKKLAQQEAEVDRILDKIQQAGLDSLTASERKALERHSRLKRQQRS